MLHVTEAHYLHDYLLALSFNDGRTGVADLGDALDRGVFRTLQNKQQFAQVTVDPELQTVQWASGQDMAPEFLYFKAFGKEPDLQDQFKRWGYLK